MKSLLMSFALSMAALFLIPLTSLAQWVQMNGPYGGTQIGSVAANGNMLIAATGGGSNVTMGIYESTNNGGTWKKINPVDSSLSLFSTRALSIVNETILAAIDGYGVFSQGIIRTSDNGMTWEQAGLIGHYVGSFFLNGINLYAVADSGIYKSTDLGNSWTRPFNQYSYSMTGDNNYLFATTSNGVYRSSDNGISWSVCYTALTFGPIEILDSTLFAKQHPMYGNGVYRSTDYGVQWTITGAPHVSYGGLAASSSSVFLYCGSGLYSSSDNGISWQQKLPNSYVSCMAFNPSNIYAGTIFEGGVSLGQVLSSSDNGDNWNSIGLPTQSITSFAEHSGRIFASTYNTGVYRSTDGGLNWSSTNTGLVVSASNLYTNCLAVKDTLVLVGMGDGFGGGGIYKSSNYGTTWTVVGLTSQTVNSLFVDDNYIYACCYSGLFRSSNNGNTWTTSSTLPFRCLRRYGDVIFGGYSAGVLKSTDNGSTWIPTSLSNDVYALSSYGTYLVAGAYDGGVFFSSDSGSTWIPKNNGLISSQSGTYLVQSVVIAGANVFAGTYFGIFLSTNGGDNWNAVNLGISDPYYFLNTLAILGNHLFAGSTNSSVWRRPISEMITSANENTESMPTDFSLEQNYPNPFNPSTTINYQLPTSNYVTLKVFDLLGREVALLVNEQLSAGSYSREWNALGFASGVYYYQIRAGNFVQTKKLLLLK